MIRPKYLNIIMYITIVFLMQYFLYKCSNILIIVFGNNNLMSKAKFYTTELYNTDIIGVVYIMISVFVCIRITVTSLFLYVVIMNGYEYCNTGLLVCYLILL